MRLIKYHGLGNDFLIVEQPAPEDAGDLARRWCHRTRGIGADGMLFVSFEHTAGHARMELFNADGTRAEISGNGIRCAAAVASLRLGLTDLDIETDAGMRALQVRPSENPLEFMVSVDMGAVASGPELADIEGPLGELGAMRAATASVGNPHVVVEVAELDRIDAADVGPRLEALWPGGINVHFLQHAGGDRIVLKHWERGVGVTEACGSGATVGATIAHEWGLVGRNVEVAMPGGSASVEVGERAVLTGPATYVATLEIEAP